MNNLRRLSTILVVIALMALIPVGTVLSNQKKAPRLVSWTPPPPGLENKLEKENKISPGQLKKTLSLRG